MSSLNRLNITGKLFFGLVATVLIGSTCKLFPYQKLVGDEHADNPNNCPYYFTLQSTLASYPLIASDKANLRFIKNKLLKFERNINQSTQPASLLAPYKNAYFGSLSQYSLTTIKSVTNEGLILELARQNASSIDDFYLDQRVYCINPLYNWHPSSPAMGPGHGPGPGPSRRILRYNLNGLYDQIPSKYTRIVSAVEDAWLTGSTPGFFFVNQTTTLDTRFMTGLPMLTALYILPKYNFVPVGTYDSAANWNYYRTDSFIDPLTRKVLDIGGVDVFTVEKKDLGTKVIPGAVILPTNVKPLFGPFQSFVNTQSYGTVYFANHITYENPHKIKHEERVIKHYFARHDSPTAFTTATNDLYQRLMLLKEKHDIILESSMPLRNTDLGKGSIEIKGMVGGRNLFVSDCLNASCTLVFNLGDAPGWHAFVNGKETQIERANFAFMATTVPQGPATVWFIYSPLSGVVTYFISIIFLLGICLAASTSRKNLTQ